MDNAATPGNSEDDDDDDDDDNDDNDDDGDDDDLTSCSHYGISGSPFLPFFSHPLPSVLYLSRPYLFRYDDDDDDDDDFMFDLIPPSV